VHRASSAHLVEEAMASRNCGVVLVCSTEVVESDRLIGISMERRAVTLAGEIAYGSEVRVNDGTDRPSSTALTPGRETPLFPARRACDHPRAPRS